MFVYLLKKMIGFPWTRKTGCLRPILCLPERPGRNLRPRHYTEDARQYAKNFYALQLPHMEDTTSIEKYPRIFLAHALCLVPEEPGPFGCRTHPPDKIEV